MNRRHLVETLFATFFAVVALYLYPAARDKEVIAQRAQLLGNVVDHLDEAIFVTGWDGDILLFSKGAEALFGVEASSVVGKPFYWMVDDASRERHVILLGNHHFPVDGKVYVMTCQVRKRDGIHFTGQVRIQAMNLQDDYGFFIKVHETDKIVHLPPPIYPQTPPIYPQPTAKEKE